MRVRGEGSGMGRGRGRERGRREREWSERARQSEAGTGVHADLATRISGPVQKVLSLLPLLVQKYSRQRGEGRGP